MLYEVITLSPPEIPATQSDEYEISGPYEKAIFPEGYNVALKSALKDGFRYADVRHLTITLSGVG